MSWTFDAPADVYLNPRIVEAVVDYLVGGGSPAPAPAPPPALGYGFPGFYTGSGKLPPPVLDPIDCSLGAGAPPTWKGREDRVAWVRHNFTKGEQALLFRLAYEADGLRVGDCVRIEKQEKGGLK